MDIEVIESYELEEAIIILRERVKEEKEKIIRTYNKDRIRDYSYAVVVLEEIIEELIE